MCFLVFTYAPTMRRYNDIDICCDCRIITKIPFRDMCHDNQKTCHDNQKQKTMKQKSFETARPRMQLSHHTVIWLFPLPSCLHQELLT